MTRFKLVPAQILAVLAFTSTGFAQQRPAFEYAVKFVCGSPPDVAAPPVAPGRYFTAINVHNPGDRPIGFRKKFAIALPGERVGPISKFFDARLGPDEAFEIDCADILQAFGPRQQQRLMKGFAVIQLFDTTAALDVVAVYTAAGRDNGRRAGAGTTCRRRATARPPRPRPRRRYVRTRQPRPARDDPQPGHRAIGALGHHRHIQRGRYGLASDPPNPGGRLGGRGTLPDSTWLLHPELRIPDHRGCDGPRGRVE